MATLNPRIPVSAAIPIESKCVLDRIVQYVLSENYSSFRYNFDTNGLLLSSHLKYCFVNSHCLAMLMGEMDHQSRHQHRAIASTAQPKPIHQWPGLPVCVCLFIHSFNQLGFRVNSTIDIRIARQVLKVIKNIVWAFPQPQPGHHSRTKYWMREKKKPNEKKGSNTSNSLTGWLNKGTAIRIVFWMEVNHKVIILIDFFCCYFCCCGFNLSFFGFDRKMASTKTAFVGWARVEV